MNDCDFYSQWTNGQKYKEKKDAEIGLLGGISINPELKRLLKSSALIFFVKSQIENIKGRITGDMATSYDYFHKIWNKDNNWKKSSKALVHWPDWEVSMISKPWF